MALSNCQNKLYDPIRKKWVKQTPEEEIRQRLIEIMLRDLRYPPHMMAVERELSALPHTQFQACPKRRADILVFAKDIHQNYPLFPLLMIECKAVKLIPDFARQIVGYNSVVQAPFLCLANQTEVVTGSFDEEAGHFRFLPGLKGYYTLLQQLQKKV